MTLFYKEFREYRKPYNTLNRLNDARRKIKVTTYKYLKIMKVENTKFVAVNYTLTVDGQVADKNPEGKPLEFVCGAGMFEIAIMVALMTTIGMVILEYLPGNRKVYLLIVNGTVDLQEDTVMNAVKPFAKKCTVKTRNLKKHGCDYIFEVDTKKEKELMETLRAVEEIEQVSLLHHEGEVRV